MTKSGINYYKHKIKAAEKAIVHCEQLIKDPQCGESLKNYCERVIKRC